MEKISCFRGRYHRTVGKFINSNGMLAAKKFLLGTDEAKARRVAERLERLWTEVVAAYRFAEPVDSNTYQMRMIRGLGYDARFDRITGKPQTCVDVDEPSWTVESLAVAEAIRQESPAIDVPYREDESALDYVARVESLRRDYKLIAFMPNSAVFAGAEADVNTYVMKMSDAASRLTSNLSSLAGTQISWAPGGMLHEALGAYTNWLRSKYTREGKLTDNGKKLIAAVERLKATTTDESLGRFGHDAIESMADYWYKRPRAKHANGKLSGHPISTETVKNMVKSLRRFLRWLNRTDRYPWQIAEHVIEDATNGHRLVDIQTEAEKKATARGPESWTLDELVALYRHATDRDRLYILLGLNAGFAQSELAHLDRAEIHLEADPPVLDFVRHKTGRCGGAKLWPETVAAIRWAWAEQVAAGHAKGQRALLKDNGQQLTRTQLSNAWNKLLDRVQKADPGFRRLPFKYLRKTSAQLVQDVGGGDSETIAIMHARAKWTGNDAQADRYYRRSLDKVYAANDRVLGYLSPMLADAPDAFSKPRKRGGGNITTEQIEQIRKAYAACGNVTKVALDVGVSRQTVYRHIGGHE